MAGHAYNYEFNAPRFVDFTKGDTDADESYFDTVSETPQKISTVFETGSCASPKTPAVSETVSCASPKTPAVSETVSCASPKTPAVSETVSCASPKTPAVSETVSCASPKTPAVSETVSCASPKTPAVSETVGCPSPKTPAVPDAASNLCPKTTAAPEAASDPSPKTAVVPEATPKAAIPEAACPPSPTSLGALRSLPRRVSQAMAGLDTVGVRQSPRLAAIAKALRRNKAARKCVGKPGPGPQQKHRTATRKQGVRRVSGVMGLNEQDEADLQAIATVRHKINKNVASTKPLKLTKPEEFHFATDSRLRGPVADGGVAFVPATVPVKAHLGPTRPQEFHFATDARVKDKDQTQGEEQEYLDFTRSLRSTTTSLNKEAAVSRTVPQPFKLTESRRRNADESKFVSVAELNLRFQTKTPQRFRTKRAGSELQLDDAKRAKPNSVGITIPHTPQLTTTRRTRPVHCLSHQQIEMKALEEAQKQTFKARPLNKKVLEAPVVGVSVDKKLPTVPEPFNITDQKKAEAASALKREEECDPADESMVSVRSLSYGRKRSATRLMPFSFDSRDKAKQHQKEEKIKKFIEEEKKLAEFHAHPMPAFESGVFGVPAKKPPTPTKLQPFNLQADQRGMVKQEKFKAQLEEESQLDAERRKFCAQSGDVVHKTPFIPQKSQRPLTEISGFALNTEVRSVKRSEYDLQRKVHEEEMLMAKKQEEERQALEEAEEIARLRQEAVHKANPAPKFKPVTLQLPQQPVTIPKSPRFATESRLRSRSQVNSTFDVSSATYTAE